MGLGNLKDLMGGQMGGSKMGMRGGQMQDESPEDALDQIEEIAKRHGFVLPPRETMLQAGPPDAPVSQAKMPKKDKT